MTPINIRWDINAFWYFIEFYVDDFIINFFRRFVEAYSFRDLSKTMTDLRLQKIFFFKKKLDDIVIESAIECKFKLIV